MKKTSLRHRFKDDFLSQSFELFHVSPDGMIFLPLLQRDRSEFGVRLPIGEDVITDAEDRMSDRHNRLLVTPMPHNSAVLGRQGRIGFPDRRQSGFGERDPKPPVPLPGLAGLVLSGTFVVAGTQPRPGGQVPRRREAAHVWPDFRNQNLGRAAVHPGNGVQQGDRLIERGDRLPDLLAEGFDLVLQIVHMGQNPADQEGMVRPESTRQRLLQGRQLLLQLPLGQIRQCDRIGLAVHQGFDHGPSRDPQNVRRHRRQLDSRILQHLVQAIGFPRPLLNQGLPVPGQVPQFPDRLVRHEASPQKPVFQQLRDPGTVRHIGLSARHVLDMGRIDEKNGESLFQNVVDGFPVDPCAFHRHMGHSQGFKPVPERQKIRRHRPEGLDLLDRLPTWSGKANTDRYRVLVHVQPRTPLDQLFHGFPPSGFVTTFGQSCRSRGASSSATLVGVLEATMRGSGSLPRQTKDGLLFRYQENATYGENDRKKVTPFSSCRVSPAHDD